MNDHREIGGVVTLTQALRRPNLDVGTVLREFWFNHFNVDGRDVPWAIADYQRALRGAQRVRLGGEFVVSQHARRVG